MSSQPARPLPEPGPAPAPAREARRVFALPTPRPGHWVARAPEKPPFPFGDARTEYFYFGRNAVYQAALRLGLPGHEVLVPAYHHGVEVEALEAAGARPVFYRVDAAMKADAADVEARIGPGARALYVIHYAGFAQPLDDLAAIAKRRGLALIEDCALSLLAADGDRPLGSRGDAAIFCLYKTLPVPDGGALWMSTPPAASPLARPPPRFAVAHLYAAGLMAGFESRGGTAAARAREWARRLARPLGTVPGAPKKLPTGTRHFDVGAADLAISALSLFLARRADHAGIVARRRENYERLAAALGRAGPPVTGPLPPGASPLFYALRCRDKDRVASALAAEGIETVDFWREGSPHVPRGAFPETEALRRQVLELPIHQDLEPADVDALAAAVRRALRKA